MKFLALIGVCLLLMGKSLYFLTLQDLSSPPKVAQLIEAYKDGLKSTQRSEIYLEKYLSESLRNVKMQDEQLKELLISDVYQRKLQTIVRDLNQLGLHNFKRPVEDYSPYLKLQEDQAFSSAYRLSKLLTFEIEKQLHKVQTELAKSRNAADLTSVIDRVCELLIANYRIALLIEQQYPRKVLAPSMLPSLMGVVIKCKIFETIQEFEPVWSNYPKQASYLRKALQDLSPLDLDFKTFLQVDHMEALQMAIDGILASMEDLKTKDSRTNQLLNFYYAKTIQYSIEALNEIYTTDLNSYKMHDNPTDRIKAFEKNRLDFERKYKPGLMDTILYWIFSITDTQECVELTAKVVAQTMATPGLSKKRGFIKDFEIELVNKRSGAFQSLGGI